MEQSKYYAILTHFFYVSMIPYELDSGDAFNRHPAIWPRETKKKDQKRSFWTPLESKRIAIGSRIKLETLHRIASANRPIPTSS